jgi:hypothetical protein
MKEKLPLPEVSMATREEWVSANQKRSGVTKMNLSEEQQKALTAYLGTAKDVSIAKTSNNILYVNGSIDGYMSGIKLTNDGEISINDVFFGPVYYSTAEDAIEHIGAIRAKIVRKKQRGK